MRFNPRFSFCDIGEFSSNVQLLSLYYITNLSIHYSSMNLNNRHREIKKKKTWLALQVQISTIMRVKGMNSRQKARIVEMSKYSVLHLFHWETPFEKISSISGIKSSLGRRIKFILTMNFLCIKSGAIGCYIMAC